MKQLVSNDTCVTKSWRDRLDSRDPDNWRARRERRRNLQWMQWTRSSMSQGCGDNSNKWGSRQAARGTQGPSHGPSVRPSLYRPGQWQFSQLENAINMALIALYSIPSLATSQYFGDAAFDGPFEFRTSRGAPDMLSEGGFGRAVRMQVADTRPAGVSSGTMSPADFPAQAASAR